jgi:hypothetical protein
MFSSCCLNQELRFLELFLEAFLRDPFFAPAFLADDFFALDFFAEDFFAVFFFGALAPLAPSRLASERPIAIACFFDFTFFPEPLLRVPFFLSCIAFSTLSPAFLEYFAILIVF